MAAGSREGLGCFGHSTKDTDPKCQEAEQEIEPQNAPCHPRAGSVLRQEQGQGLNYLSPTSSVCWEANKGCRGFTWLTSLVPRSPTAFPLTTGPAHCPRRRLAVIQARILGQPSPAVPRKRPSGAGAAVPEGREAGPSCASLQAVPGSVP